MNSYNIPISLVTMFVKCFCVICAAFGGSVDGSSITLCSFSSTANTQVVEKSLTSLPHKATRMVKLKKGAIPCKGKHIYTKVK